MIAHALVLSMFSSLVFAEGGADRVFERSEARVKEAVAAAQKKQDDHQNTAKSDAEKASQGSS